MNTFRRKRSEPVLSRDESVRQGRAVRVAQDALGDVEAVRAFLNCHHNGLDGRPIDLAVESDDGLARVEAAIAATRPGP
ncbi:MAG TPA: antitoxin Xre/MbcA/ParS toxin-binding domain-containing protein [Allosphingosinicella sp.]|nr:antitoxin Xre/MbcA/ParS toxin-binding domain-containing protein [Allosphingosinicella sp.]